MKNNNKVLVATTLAAMASVTLAAPLPQNYPVLTAAELRAAPKGFTYDPTFTYDPRTRTQTNTQTTVNNGNGDGNSGGRIEQSKNSGNGNQRQVNNGNGDGNSGGKVTSNQHSGNGNQQNNGDGDGNSGGRIASTKNSGNGGNGVQHIRVQNSTPKGGPSDSKPHSEPKSGDKPKDDKKPKDGKNPTEERKPEVGPKARRHITRITGDGDGNSGHSMVEIEKNDGNHSGNRHIHNHMDSHNSQVDTSFGLFRRGREGLSGDGDGNSGHAEVELSKGNGNHAYNTHVHNHKDSHNSQVDTSFGLFRRDKEVLSGDGDGNSGHSKVELIKDNGNHAHNTHVHNHADSHNVAVDNGFSLFRRDGKRVVISGDGDGNTGHAKVEISKHNGDHSGNTNVHDHYDSHNVGVNSDLMLPIPF